MCGIKSYMLKKPDNYKDIEQSYIIAESWHYVIFYIQYLFKIHHSSSFIYVFTNNDTETLNRY